MRATSVGEALIGIAVFCVWVAGWVLAKGFWSTTAAVFLVPFWSSYLVIERALIAMGWLQC